MNFLLMRSRLNKRNNLLAHAVIASEAHVPPATSEALAPSEVWGGGAKRGESNLLAWQGDCFVAALLAMT